MHVGHLTPPGASHVSGVSGRYDDNALFSLEEPERTLELVRELSLTPDSQYKN